MSARPLISGHQTQRLAGPVSAHEQTCPPTELLIGIKIIDAERELDRAFVDGAISTIELRSRLNAIAALQGELRAVHLETHLAQRSVLTPQQVAKYDVLRGYRDGAMPHAGHSPGRN